MGADIHSNLRRFAIIKGVKRLKRLTNCKHGWREIAHIHLMVPKGWTIIRSQ